MCGLLYAKRLDGKLARKLIERRYEKQKTRGRQGFGFVELNRGKVGEEFRSEEEDEINTPLKKSICDEILFHHRFPTSTPNFVEATHPIKVSNKKLKYDYYVVHNGVITNDEELKEKHNEMGFKYITEISKQYVTSGNTYKEIMFNDSEAFAIDFALSIEQDKEMEAKGNIAFIAIQFEKKTKQAIALYFGRNTGNPLKKEVSEQIFCLSSETGQDLKPNILNRYDYITGEFSETEKKIGIEKVYETTYPSSWYNSMGFNNNSKVVELDKVSEEDFDWSNPQNSNKKLLGSGKKNQILDDDDYCYQLEALYDDIRDTKKQIEVAQNMGNVDLEIDLSIELEALEDEMENLIEENINRSYD